MNLRYISLGIEHELDSGIDNDFSDKFCYNTSFIDYFLSKAVRKEKIETGRNFNMLYILLSAKTDTPYVEESEVFKCLSIYLPFDKAALEEYLRMSDEKTRFEFYLSLYERGYQIACDRYGLPLDMLLSLNDQFRARDYRTEWLFKKKRIRDHGINVSLDCVFTSYDFKLMISVFDLKKNLMACDYIFRTYPDWIFWGKTVRHLVITDTKLIITDFLDHPQFECELAELSRGIIKPKCVDKNFSNHIYSENTKKDFERLTW